MINSIRIQNLRSIKDSGFIELKPINILLGANSSGKSTFLRSFPLFAQSVVKELRGPVAWFDSALVDFGDYKTARNKYAADEEGIAFSFKFSEVAPVNYRFLFISNEYDEVNDSEFSNGILSFTLNDDNKGSYVNSIHFKLENADIRISVSDRMGAAEICINEKKYNGTDKILLNHNTGVGILPSLVTLKSGDESSSLSSMMHNKIITILKKYSDKRLQNIHRLDSIICYDHLDVNGFLKRIKRGGDIKSLQKVTVNWNSKSEQFVELYSYFILLKLNSIISYFNREIANFYCQCDYIAPLRADASRYYRLQGLQVQTVDPSGSNLLEFIASLSAKEKNSFDEYIMDILGVTVSAPSESGMKSLRVNTRNGDFSIADVGYGYSQVLPVIAKLWHTSYVLNNNYQLMSRLRFRDFVKSTILMEQPELHLHPAMQAKIADALIKTVQAAEKGAERASLIIETHSQTLINRIGRRIREGLLSPNDVNILLFSKDEELKNTSISQIKFTEKGQLMDWPYGFFDPED